MNGTQTPDIGANRLFPVFLKLEKLNVLLVGGGNVAMEKLGALLGNSPEARIQVVAKEISEEVREVLNERKIPFREREFLEEDLAGIDLAVIAVNGKEVSSAIQEVCRKRGVLTNVADTPDLCDFYLSSVVQKGNLKIAISTNGKSPTIAKRIKEVLNEALPQEMEEVLNNMERIRGTLSGDFSDKVRQLNEITRVLAPDKSVIGGKRKSGFVALLILAAAALFTLGYLAAVYFSI